MSLDYAPTFDFDGRFRPASSFSSLAILNVPYGYASGCSLVGPRRQPKSPRQIHIGRRREVISLYLSHRRGIPNLSMVARNRMHNPGWCPPLRSACDEFIESYAALQRTAQLDLASLGTRTGAARHLPLRLRLVRGLAHGGTTSPTPNPLISLRKSLSAAAVILTASHVEWLIDVR